jgi:hypothetical protein
MQHEEVGSVTTKKRATTDGIVPDLIKTMSCYLFRHDTKSSMLCDATDANAEKTQS